MKQRSGMPYDVVAFETDENAKFWTNAEEGAFHRLMRHQWIHGSIPADVSKIAVLMREPLEVAQALWMTLSRSFKPLPDDATRLANSKTEREREYVEWSRQKRVKAGKHGADVRYGKAPAKEMKDYAFSSNAMPSQPNPSQPKAKIKSDSKTLDGSKNASGSSETRATSKGNVSLQKQLLDVSQPADEQGAAVLFSIWQEHHGLLPECIAFTDDRRRKAEVRLRKHASNRIAYITQFEAAVKRAAMSQFCCGAGEQGWRLTFDWLIENDKNMLRVLEGNYDDRPAAPAKNGNGKHAQARATNQKTREAVLADARKDEE